MPKKGLSMSENPTLDSEKEDWFDFGRLIAKHPIRWNIWMVLRFYPELNIKQLSEYVKESRYTVSRHLKKMEEDGLVISREVEPEKRGKYAPKYYRANPSMSGPRIEDKDSLEEFMKSFNRALIVPKNPEDRLAYYKALIREYKSTIINYSKTIKSFNLLFKNFEEALPSPDIMPLNESKIKKADEFFKENIGGLNQPYFIGTTFDKSHFKKFQEIYSEFWKKTYLLQIDQQKNPDITGNYYSLMTIIFPNKKLLELKKRMYSEPS